MILSVAMPLGQIVASRKGRDQDQLYVVVGYGNSPFILVADGRNRKAAAPKKKNVRHVKPMGSIAQNVAHKLERDEKVTDEELRQAISELCTPDGFVKKRTRREI